VQRSVARQLAEREGWNFEPVSAEVEDRDGDVILGMAMQDKLLVVRIRRHLVEQGCHPGQILTPPMALCQPSFPAPVAPAAGGDRLQTLSMPQLVAAHILRMKERSALFARPNSRLARVTARERSPLAMCETFV